MNHLPDLIRDLGYILSVAAFVTLIMSYLRQPLVLGYLIAGCIVGPHFSFSPAIRDVEGVKVWAEIGIVFLLFGLGLEFSFHKLTKVGRGAIVTALVEVAFMLGFGYLTGLALGWTPMNSLFLGGVLSISSTTIIVKAFEELGLKEKKFAHTVYGILIVEDLVAILLLVFLSTVAVSRAFSGKELAYSSARLFFFLILWFVVGTYLLPNFLARIRRLLNPESTLIIVMGLCLMMVMLSTELGFSPALGAFVMGSLLSEIPEGRQAEHMLRPIQYLFSAIFFVSVGMLIDPNLLLQHWGVVVLISVITVFGKLLSTSLGALVSGQGLRESVSIGMSLAQIGEFSFIIATLGVSLGVTSKTLYPIAVGVSVLTTFITPYLIQSSDRLFNFLDRRLPKSVLERIVRYQTAVHAQSGSRLGQLLWDAYGSRILLNSVMILAIGFASELFLFPFLYRQLHWAGVLSRFLCAIVALAFSLPFLWAVVMGSFVAKLECEEAEAHRLKNLEFGFFILRLFIGILLVGFLVSRFSRIGAVSGLFLVLLAVVVFFLSRLTEPLYRMLESKFIRNFKGDSSD